MMYRTIWAAAAGATAIATLAIAGGASASSATPPAGIPATSTLTTGERSAKVCGHLDEIDAVATGRIATIEARITTMNEALDSARSAGHDRAARRLERHITTATERVDHIEQRLERVTAWAADNCPPT